MQVEVVEVVDVITTSSHSSSEAESVTRGGVLSDAELSESMGAAD